jgi:hypothetical protein
LRRRRRVQPDSLRSNMSFLSSIQLERCIYSSHIIHSDANTPLKAPTTLIHCRQLGSLATGDSVGLVFGYACQLAMHFSLMFIKHHRQVLLLGDSLILDSGKPRCDYEMGSSTHSRAHYAVRVRTIFKLIVSFLRFVAMFLVLRSNGCPSAVLFWIGILHLISYHQSHSNPCALSDVRRLQHRWF